MGVAGIILGIIGIVFAFLPYLGIVIAVPCGLVGVVLSSVKLTQNRRQGEGKMVATAGIITSALSIVVAIVWLIVLQAAITRT